MVVPMELKVVESKGQFDIIQLAEDSFVVRKRYVGLFGFGSEKQTFMVLNRNGTDFTFDSVCEGVTVGSYDRCKYVFNANILKQGKF